MFMRTASKIATLAALAWLGLSTVNTAAAESIGDLPAGVYALDNTHTSITWKVSHFGLSNYTARFTKFDAEIRLNPKNPERSSVTAEIDPASLRTDFPNADKKDFDAELAFGEGWFNARKFSTIKFVSRSLKRTGRKTGVLRGDLTFLGVKKSVALNVTLNRAMTKHPFAKKAAIGFSATGTLRRSDFGMNTFVPNIGNTVTILIEAEFVKK